MNIRNSVKAVIVHNGYVLLTKNKDDEGYFYLFPGGGQVHGETFYEALKRECLEEIGFEVEMGELLFVREYIGKNHEHSIFDYHVHQVEFYFGCTLSGNGGEPSNPDEHQIGVEWVEINKLLDHRIYPKEITKYITNEVKKEKDPIYLGDVN